MRASEARVGLVSTGSSTKSAALGSGLDARGAEARARAEGAGAWGWEAGGREAWAGEVESPRLYMAVSMSGTSQLLEG